MGRPRGSRNADYDQKRRKLARRVVNSLVASPAEHASLRELARAAGVSVSTMRHYFGDRDGIIQAAIEEMGQAADRYIKGAAAEPGDSPQEQLVRLLRALVDSWTRYELGRAHAVGMAEGFYGPCGPAYVQHLLEPFVTTLEHVLDRLRETRFPLSGSMRHAALALIGPVWLALAHQESLGGQPIRPMDLDAFIDDHVERFLRGWSEET